QGRSHEILFIQQSLAEAMALVRALNKMTKAGIPESVRIA
ncbi:hypothetical protein M5Y67_24205, partial [Enterobacter roggenkampii]